MNFVLQGLQNQTVKDLFESTWATLFKPDNMATIKVGSVCSGLGVAEMVFDHLNYALQELLHDGKGVQLKAWPQIGSSMFYSLVVFKNYHTKLTHGTHYLIANPCQFETVFMCEIEGWKAEWIHRAFNPPILFEDMKCLGTGRDKDAITNQFHSVPKAESF